MRQRSIVLLLGFFAVLPGCADQGFEDTEGPAVTYSYNAASDYEQVVQKADDYCEDEYGGEPGYSGNAEVIDQSEEDGAYKLTFVCK